MVTIATILGLFNKNIKINKYLSIFIVYKKWIINVFVTNQKLNYRNVYLYKAYITYIMTNYTLMLNFLEDLRQFFCKVTYTFFLYLYRYRKKTFPSNSWRPDYIYNTYEHIIGYCYIYTLVHRFCFIYLFIYLFTYISNIII